VAGRALTAFALAAALGAVATGCGAGDGDPPAEPTAGTVADPLPSAFPSPAPGQTLAKFATRVSGASARLRLATTVHPVGHARFAFTVQRDGRPLAGPTVLYASPAADRSEVAGPLPAPGTAVATAAGAGATVYEVPAVDLHHRGRYDLLTLTETGHGELVAGRARVGALPPGRDPAPDVGERVTLPSALAARTRGGPAALILPGRCPPGDCADLAAAMSKPSLALGERVAVVRPGPRAERELRRELALSPSPWLLTLDADGRLAARLEGAVSPQTAERALQAAIVRSGG